MSWRTAACQECAAGALGFSPGGHLCCGEIEYHNSIGAWVNRPCRPVPRISPEGNRPTSHTPASQHPVGTKLCPSPAALTEPTEDPRRSPTSRAFSPGCLIHVNRPPQILGDTHRSRITSRATLASVHSPRVVSHNHDRSQSPSPGDCSARPFASRCSERTLLRCGPVPPIQPRSNRSTPCGRRRVAASTVLRPPGVIQE